MPNSMTGFGRGEYSDDQWQVSVEIKTVNHRYSDISIKLPKNLSSLESQIRKQVSSVIARGRVDVYINIVPLSERPYIPRVNWSLARSYVESAQELSKEFGLEGSVTTQYLLGLPDVVTMEEEVVDSQEIWLPLKKALDIALGQVMGLRQAEGQRLMEDILYRIGKISRLVTEIQERSPQVVQEYAQKLQERMASFLDAGGIEPERLASEAALFADKSSITEEIIRMNSHLAEIHNLVQESEPIGRKLDFIVQELNRETNTIGSKANDEQIATLVIDCKAEIEKIREQAQNIE